MRFLLPLKHPKKNLFLINRGWVSKEDYENGTEEAEGNVTIQGVLSPFKRFGLNLVDQIYLDGWPSLFSRWIMKQQKMI